MSTYHLLALVGFAAGLGGGLVGVGGGVLLVPVLHLGFGLPLTVSVGTSLVVITGTSISSALGYLKRGEVFEGLAMELQIGAVVGALGAAWLAPRAPTDWVAGLFALALIWAAAMIWWKGRDEAGFLEPSHDSARWFARSLSPLGGAAAGLLGVGGGLVQVPIIRLVLGLRMRLAVATSTVMVGWTASVAAAIYWWRGELRDDWILPLLLGTLVGGRMAPRLGEYLPSRVLEGVFVVLLLFGALRMQPFFEFGP